MSSDWWSRKLNNQPAPPKPNLPPVQAPLRFPAQSPVPMAQPQVTNTRVLDPFKSPTEQISMGEAIHLWKGGEAARVEGGLSCPSCGSHLVFTRSGNRINGAQPAPRCFSCGYNGSYSQGDQSNWAV